MAAGSRFSKYLKQSRVNAGLSQKQVSEKLGYSSSQFISNWERGLSAPPAKAVKKLAELYSVSIEEFCNLLLQDTLQQVTLDFKKKFKKIL
jgi:transcriptional regulator with XRE-family HTH domain